MANVTDSPSTINVTTHGLVIFNGNSAIGGISEWNADQRQDVALTYELGNVTPTYDGVGQNPGEAYETVPGNVSGTTIGITRYEIYKSKFEDSFKVAPTDPALTMLCNQKKPLQLRELWKTPAGTPQITNIYYGFWFSSLGKKMSATGDRLLRMNASGTYRVVRPAESTLAP